MRHIRRALLIRHGALEVAYRLGRDAIAGRRPRCACAGTAIGGAPVDADAEAVGVDDCEVGAAELEASEDISVSTVAVGGLVRRGTEATYVRGADDVELRPICGAVYCIIVRRTRHFSAGGQAATSIQPDQTVAHKGLISFRALRNSALDEAGVRVRRGIGGVAGHVDGAGTGRAALVAGVHAGLYAVGHKEAVVVAQVVDVAIEAEDGAVGA